MTESYDPELCTIPIAYLGGFQIGDCYVTGQPADPQGFQAIAAAGVKSVICLREPTEPGFDLHEDAALLAQHISYTNIPIPHGIEQSDFNQRADLVRACLAAAQKPLLMHCSTGDRASALWAVHLFADCGVPKEQAIQYGHQSGLANPAFVQLVQNYSTGSQPISLEMGASRG
jgi:uncharacterized protein (TIGR01244 family)